MFSLLNQIHVIRQCLDAIEYRDSLVVRLLKDREELDRMEEELRQTERSSQQCMCKNRETQAEIDSLLFKEREEILGGRASVEHSFRRLSI